MDFMSSCYQGEHTIVYTAKYPCPSKEDEVFSVVTGGRAPSFHDLSMGETAALSLSKGMRRGQNSPVDKSSEKTSPEALERKKRFDPPYSFHDNYFMPPC